MCAVMFLQMILLPERFVAHVTGKWTILTMQVFMFSPSTLVKQKETYNTGQKMTFKVK
jgi:hypothetical protein